MAIFSLEQSAENYWADRGIDRCDDRDRAFATALGVCVFIRHGTAVSLARTERFAHPAFILRQRDLCRHGGIRLDKASTG